MSDDAIVILREDHRVLRRDFRAFRRTTHTQTAQRGDIVQGLLVRYGEHIDGARDVLLPAVREVASELDAEVLAAYERYGVAERLLDEIASLEPYDKRLAAKMRVLGELTERHLDRQEHVVFPVARRPLGRTRLQRLGRAIRGDRDGSRIDGRTQESLAAAVGALMR
jgi:hypothetical protein